MLSQLQQFVNRFSRPKNWLLIANILLVFFLIVLNNANVLPLRVGDFVFFGILVFAFALYRPGWTFLFFVGTIPFEIVNLAPESFGLTVRPYQFIGAILIIAVLVRLLTKKLYFKLLKLNLADYLILALVVLSFLSALLSSEKIASLKLALIFLSFSTLYFLTKNYVQNIEDLKKVVPFFLSSSIVVVMYGLWQNIRFMQNLSHFEVMPGRPNATFSEPDWLGIFLVFLISAVYALVYYFQKRKAEDAFQTENQNPQGMNYFLFFSLLISFLLLIVTVSRSAWLGALVATLIFLFVILTRLKFNPSFWKWKRTLRIKLFIFPALLLAILAAYFFPLTKFQIWNRAQSSKTGEQKITLSCVHETSLPEKIGNVSELEKFGCRHINLEEIEREKANGKFVAEILRPDPNVSIRLQIYRRSWEEIKNNLIFGIGLGNIGMLSGRDEAGNFLNSSNIFLEIWLGIGTFGFLALSILFLYILLEAIKKYFFSQEHLIRSVSLFIIVSWFALLTANLFNAGMMLGFLWVYLAVSQIKEKESKYDYRN